MSIRSTRISNVDVVNVSDEEKQEGCTSDYKYESECMSLLKPQSQLGQLHDDDEDSFATSLIDRYAARPVSLQNIRLATFTVMYDVIQSSTKKEETDGVNDEEEEMQNTENDTSLTKNKLQKVQISCRTREILPFEAASVLSME